MLPIMSGQQPYAGSRPWGFIWPHFEGSSARSGTGPSVSGNPEEDGIAVWDRSPSFGDLPAGLGETQPGACDRHPRLADGPPKRATGGFLGGTRSPRPHRTAVQMARRCIPDGCVEARPLAKWGAMLRLARCLSLRACGARPSGGLVIRAGMAFRGKPGITLGPVFSEGRTPCVRVAGPDASRGIT